MTTTSLKPATLKPHQLNALATLASNPGYAWTPPAILSLLRKQGLVGKVKGRDESGRQKTTSPITDAGRTLLASQGLLPIGVSK